MPRGDSYRPGHDRYAGNVDDRGHYHDRYATPPDHQRRQDYDDRHRQPAPTHRQPPNPLPQHLGGHRLEYQPSPRRGDTPGYETPVRSPGPPRHHDDHGRPLVGCDTHYRRDDGRGRAALEYPTAASMQRETSPGSVQDAGRHVSDGIAASRNAEFGGRRGSSGSPDRGRQPYRDDDRPPTDQRDAPRSEQPRQAVPPPRGEFQRRDRDYGVDERTERAPRGRTRSRSPKPRSPANGNDRNPAPLRRRSREPRERGRALSRSSSPFRHPRSPSSSRDRSPTPSPEPCEVCAERARKTEGATLIDHTDPDGKEFQWSKSYLDIPADLSGDLREIFKEGDVLSDRLCEFSKNKKGSVYSSDFTGSAAGKVCIKIKVPYIVKRVYPRHLMCWIGRSGGGKSLQRVPEIERAEYVGLGDSEKPEEPGCESPHDQAQVLCRCGRTIKATTHILASMTVMVEPTVNFRREGRLSDDGLALLEQVADFCGNFKKADAAQLTVGIGINIAALSRLKEYFAPSPPSEPGRPAPPAAKVTPTAAGPDTHSASESPAEDAASRQSDSQGVANPRQTPARNRQPALSPTTFNAQHHAYQGHMQIANANSRFDASGLTQHAQAATHPDPARRNLYGPGEELSRRQTTGFNEKGGLPY